MLSARNPSRSTVTMPFIWATIAGIAVIALMWSTVQSMINIWSTSDTFTHGYFVIPLFIWLVWVKRDELATIAAKPDWSVLLLLLTLGACWLLSKLSGIQVMEHIAFVLILICTLWSVLGHKMATAILFPLLFLLFLAPIGDELVPALMHLTADMTVWAIQITGIPIYREGLYFSLPSGNWSVVEACSGIRYLIASVMLGTLYAYLNYTSYRLRVLFVAISIVVPVFANSVRAYIIVMLGHFSDNKLATGVDHLIYGWVFFGIVMFALFSLGNLLKGKTVTTGAPNSTESRVSCCPTTHTPNVSYMTVLIATLLCVAVWPSWAVAIKSKSSNNIHTLQSSEVFPDSIVNRDMEGDESTQTLWQPTINGYDTRVYAEYVDQSDKRIRAMAFIYAEQEQGKEMISSANVLVRSMDKHWRTKESRSIKLPETAGLSVSVKQSILTSTQNELVVWQWYSVGGKITASPIEAKLLEVKNQLMLRESLSITYILVADQEIDMVESKLSEIALNIVEKGK